MTRQWRDRVFGGFVGLAIAIIPVFITLSFTVRYDEKISMREKVQQLEIEKANIKDVDEKCAEIRKEVDANNQQIIMYIRDIQVKTDKIFELMITEKDKK